MNSIEKEKLENLIYKKYNELAFSYDVHKQSWSEYLHSIGCVKLSENYQDTFVFLIEDPSPFGGYIQMSEETALKILVIGLP